MVMTRSFTSMLLGLHFLAGRWARNLQFVRDLQRMAEHFAPRIHAIAEVTEAFVEQHSFGDYVFLGQGPFHGIARKASLKVMEMSCSYSQFFHATGLGSSSCKSGSHDQEIRIEAAMGRAKLARANCPRRSPSAWRWDL
jgi:hypothetical protein